VNSEAKSGEQAGTIDVSGDLGVDERKTIFPVYAELNIGGPFNLFADFYSFSSSGEKTLTESLTFNQHTFAAGSDTKGEYKQDQFSFGLKYDISSRDNIDIALHGGMLYEKMELDISNSLTSTSDSLDVPFPYLGVSMENRFMPDFSWGMLLEGLALSFQDYSTSYFDFSFYLKYFFTNNISLRTGYRYENIDSEKEEKEFSSESGGAFLGVNMKL